MTKHKRKEAVYLSKRVIDFLVSEYKQGTLNISKEAKKLGCSRKCIYDNLHRQNVNMRGVGCKSKSKKSFLQKIRDYFNK